MPKAEIEHLIASDGVVAAFAHFLSAQLALEQARRTAQRLNGQPGQALAMRDRTRCAGDAIRAFEVMRQEAERAARDYCAWQELATIEMSP